MSGRQKVLAPSDMGDFLRRIINDNCEMVGGSDVLSRQNDVSEKVWDDCYFPVLHVMEAQVTGKLRCLAGVEPPSWFAVLREFSKPTTGPWIKRSLGAMGSIRDLSEFGFNLLAGAETRIDDL